MPKSKDKKGDKSKKSKKEDGESVPTEPSAPTIPEIPPEPEIPPDIRTIKITLEGFRNLVPLYPMSDVSVQVNYLDRSLGESSKAPVTDEKVTLLQHTFILECNVNSPEEIDQLISNPVTFTVIISYGSHDESIYTTVRPSFNVGQGDYGMSIESAADLFESFTGRKVDRSVLAPGLEEKEKEKEEPQADAQKGKGSKKRKSKEKIKKGNKPSPKSSKSKANTVTSDTTEKAEAKEPEKPKDPLVLGMCTLDLLGIFLGHEQVLETLTVYPLCNYMDMPPIKILPRLVVEACVDKSWPFTDNKFTNVVNFTVESMYNVPNIMSAEMDYAVCTFLPSIESKMQPTVLKNAKRKETRDMHLLKHWPGLPRTDGPQSATKYRIDSNTLSIKNNTEVNVHEVVRTNTPRIEWNLMSRKFMGADGCGEFYGQLKKFRCLPLEIFVTKHIEPPKETTEESSPAKGKAKSPKSGKEKKDKKGNKEGADKENQTPDYLHLMALVDISSLLYPGANKTRVACQVTTYHEQELLEATGFTDSFFMPKKEEIVEMAQAQSAKKSGKSKSDKSLKSNSKQSKSSGSKKSKDSKKSKGSKGSKKEKPEASAKDLAELLPPPPPPPPPPSTKVYSDKGEPTFIIVEVELFKPYAPAREIEDLTANLQGLLSTKPHLPKVLVTPKLSEELYKETICRLIDDMNRHYLNYLKEVEDCSCYENNPRKPADFLTYLRRIGVYQTYLNTITNATVGIVNNNYTFKGRCDVNDKEYQNFISEVFVDLVGKVNGVLNEIVTYGTEAVPIGNLTALDPLFLYAKEACELCADTLAERYYLERICLDEKNADFWFDYAVFCMETKQSEKALECVKKALNFNTVHRYSLLLFGILLSENGKNEEAETCFLTVTMQYPRWSEGWCILMIFYDRHSLREGVHLCEEMAKKYFGDDRNEKDYFTQTDELAWTSTICQKDVYTQTAVLLIKMRCFDYAQKALSYCASKPHATLHYLCAVMCYYREQYEIALGYLEVAEKKQGLDYGTAGLKGHCLLALGRFQEARTMYSHVLKMYNRPEDVHLIYVNMSVVKESLQNDYEARKIVLLACKYSPTPYTWLAAGLLYYKQHDLISAEACMTEANLLDNRLPEIWAYLAFINAELGRLDEASLCYKQAMKNKLNNKELLNKIHELPKRWKNL